MAEEKFGTIVSFNSCIYKSTGKDKPVRARMIGRSLWMDGAVTVEIEEEDNDDGVVVGVFEVDVVVVVRLSSKGLITIT